MADTQPRRASVTESPWYWVYAFCAAALIGLVLLGPKMLERQLQEERTYQGRRRGLENSAGLEPVTEMSTRGNTLMTLWPLFAILIVTLVSAWVVLWWKHFWPRASETRRENDEVAT